MLRPRSCPSFVSCDYSENKNVSYVKQKVKQSSIFTEQRENEIWSLLDNSTEADQREQQQEKQQQKQRNENFNITPLNRNTINHQPCYLAQIPPSNVTSEGQVPVPLTSMSDWSPAFPSENDIAVNLCFDSIPINNNSIVMIEHPPSPKTPKKRHNMENGDLSIICPQMKHEMTYNNVNHSRNQRDDSFDLAALHYPNMRSRSCLLHARHDGFQQFHLNAKIGDEPIRFYIPNRVCPNDVHSMDRTQTDAYDGTFHDISRFFVGMNGFLLHNSESIDNASTETDRANCDVECSYELHEQTDYDMLFRCTEEIYDCSTDDEFTDFDIESDENLSTVRPGNPVARVLESGDDDENLLRICEEQQNSSAER